MILNFELRKVLLKDNNSTIKYARINKIKAVTNRIETRYTSKTYLDISYSFMVNNNVYKNRVQLDLYDLTFKGNSFLTPTDSILIRYSNYFPSVNKLAMDMP